MISALIYLPFFSIVQEFDHDLVAAKLDSMMNLENETSDIVEKHLKDLAAKLASQSETLDRIDSSLESVSSTLYDDYQ